jgi:hypothetical protein
MFCSNFLHDKHTRTPLKSIFNIHKPCSDSAGGSGHVPRGTQRAVRHRYGPEGFTGVSGDSRKMRFMSYCIIIVSVSFDGFPVFLCLALI